MDTKGLERNIKAIIKSGSGYGPEFLPILTATKKILKRINKGRPTAENYFELGTLCLKLEDNGLAFEAFNSGYQLNKHDVNCGTYCALLLEQQEKWYEALNYYQELNTADPQNILIAERMLFIFYIQKDIKQVLTICYYFLEKKLYYPAIYEYMSRFFYDSGNIEKAIEYLNNALVLDKDNVDYKIRIIPYLYRNKEFQAVVDYEEFINSSASIPLHIKLLYGNALAGAGNIKAARDYYVSLLRKNFNKNQILVEIAYFHMNFELNAVKGRFVNNYILKREPNNIQALTNLALHSGSDYSISAYEKVLEICPDVPLFRTNYGYTLLSIGEFDKGFEFYESRVVESQPFLVGRLTYPKSIINKKLFVWREQGIGDQLMWSWIFRLLEDNNVEATIHIESRLLELMQNSFPRIKFIGVDPIDVCYNEDFNNYDEQLLIHSLGKYFIPEIQQAQKLFEEKQQYREPHLKADIAKVAYWGGIIKKSTNLKTVGICWRSGLLGDMRDYSYLIAENIVEIFSELNCTIVNLQYDYTDEEINLLQTKLGERFINFTDIDLKNDQDDLAGLISNLDLVFSVGTSVLALSGSLGVTTLCPTGFGSLGKPFNIMVPVVKSIAGPKPARENSQHYASEISSFLEL